ncbi:MAG: flavodoxin family protein [Halanaerobium sp.]
MNLAIIYYSESGNTKKTAELIKKGAESFDAVKVKLMSIEEVDVDFVNSAQAVIFGTPTYMGDLSHQLKNWFDSHSNQLKLNGKLGAAFATQRYIGGGATNALKTVLSHLLVKGMLAYSAGAAEGKPYTHFGAVCIEAGDQQQQERAEIFGRRVAKKALELFNGSV